MYYQHDLVVNGPGQIYLTPVQCQCNTYLKYFCMGRNTSFFSNICYKDCIWYVAMSCF